MNIRRSVSMPYLAVNPGLSPRRSPQMPHEYGHQFSSYALQNGDERQTAPLVSSLLPLPKANAVGIGAHHQCCEGCASNDHDGQQKSPPESKTAKKKSSIWPKFKRYLKLGRTPKRKPEEIYDDLRRPISVEIMVDGRPILRNGIALIDVHCPANLMSRDFAKLFTETFGSAKGKLTLIGLGGGEFRSVGTLSGRWFCQETKKYHNRKFSFDPKYLEAEWQVSESDERFDVIIGKETIHRYDLLEAKNEIAAPTFRYKPDEIDDATAKLNQEKQNEKIKRNDELKRQKQMQMQEEARKRNEERTQ